MYRSAKSLRRAGLLLVSAVLAFADEGRAQAALPPGWEGGLFEVRVPGIAAQTLTVLLNPEGGILLPVADVLELTGSAVEEGQDGRLMMPVSPEGHQSQLDLGARLVLTHRGDSIPLDRSDVRMDEGRLMLDMAPLAAWLDAQAELQWEYLRITLTREPPFPAQSKAEREAARDKTLRALSHLQIPASNLDAPLPPSSGIGLLSWAVSSGDIDPRKGSSISLQVGGALLGGELSVGALGRTGQMGEDRFEYGNLSYRRSFPHGSLVRDLFAGDVTTRGTLGRAIRGMVVTNRPRTLPSVFDRVTVDPDMPPGWEMEVYRDGQLVGFSDPLRPGPVHVPVEFGRTDLQVRAFGPGGQERTVSTLFHIPTSQLPKGRMEYSAGAGACRSQAECRYLGYVDADFGVSRSLTVGAGAEAREDTLGVRTIRPSMSLSFAPSGGWLAQVQRVAQSHVDARLDYSGMGRIHASFRGALYSASAFNTAPSPDGQGRWRLSGNLGSPIGRFSVSASGSRGDGPRGRGAEFLSGSYGRMTPLGYVQGSYERDGYDRSGSWGGRLISGWTDRYLPGSTGTVAARVREGQIHNLEAGLSAAIKDGTFLSGAIRWLKGTQPTFSLSISRRLGFGKFQSLVRTTRGGPTRGSYTLGGTLAYEESGLTAVPDHAVGLSGIRGRVFYDRDGDGLFGPGDEPVPEIHVSAGYQRGQTDENGRYRIWGVAPYEPIVVHMDTIRSFVPDWAPATARVVLRAVPNLFRDVDIPLVPTKELLGAVTAGPGVLTVGGVTLRLENRTTGDVQEVITFSDGTFYVPRIRVGRYRMRVSPQSLAALDAVAHPDSLDFEILATDEDPFVEVPAVRLERASPWGQDRDGLGLASASDAVVDQMAWEVFASGPEPADHTEPPEPWSPPARDNDVPDAVATEAKAEQWPSDLYRREEEGPKEPEPSPDARRSKAGSFSDSPAPLPVPERREPAETAVVDSAWVAVPERVATRLTAGKPSPVWRPKLGEAEPCSPIPGSGPDRRVPPAPMPPMGSMSLRRGAHARRKGYRSGRAMGSGIGWLGGSRAGRGGCPLKSGAGLLLSTWAWLQSRGPPFRARDGPVVEQRE